MKRSIRIDGVVVLRGYASEPDCLPHERGDALGLHLFHDFTAIAFDRAHADIQPDRNSVTREPFHHEIKDFDLAGCQSCEPIAESTLRLLKILLLETPCKRPVDRGNELGVVNRLFDKVFGPGFDGSYSHRHIRVPRNEYDRKRDVATFELAHEGYTVCSGHPHVGDNASGVLLIE